MPVDTIRSRILEAYKSLEKRWDGGAGLTSRDIEARARIEIYLADYGDLLASIHRLAKGDLPRRIQFCTGKLLDTPAAKIAGMVRAVADKAGWSPTRLEERALGLSIWKKNPEKVHVCWVPKDKGGYRPICKFGPVRTAHSLMVRDMLMIAGVSQENNYAQAGMGGECALLEKISSLMKEGKEWWWTPDIKSAYASIHRGHFNWMGIDRRILLSVFFLGECAKIEMSFPKAAKAGPIGTHPALKGDIIPDDISTLIVRRGLPQGSPLSPLLAGALITHLWRQNNSVPEAVMVHQHDDLFIGTETKVQAVGVKKCFIEALSTLPAGPLEFHQAPILAASSGKVTALGYKVQPGRGHRYLPDGSRSTHVKPANKRTTRFKRRLANKLQACETFEQRVEVARQYERRWYASQKAWTKVPDYSSELSQAITATYLDDFEHGIPLGTWAYGGLPGHRRGKDTISRAPHRQSR